MATPINCAMQVSPDGKHFNYTSVSDVQALLQADITKVMAQRYFSSRDTSHLSVDVQNDRNEKRRGKLGWSLSRDMLEGPQSCHDATSLDGKNLQGRPMDSGIDPNCFYDEFAQLVTRGVVSPRDMPDFEDDKAITKFFAKVYDAAHHYARQGKARLVIDAAPSIYVFTELLKHSTVVIKEEFTQLWARRVFPINNHNTWLPSWSWKRIATRGILPQAMNLDQLASGAPNSGEQVTPVVRPFMFYTHAASWTNLELLQHAEAVANGATNLRLDQSRIDVAVRMMLMKEDLLAWFGDTDVDIRGLYSAEADTGIERIPAGTQFGAGTTEADRQLLTRTVKQIIDESEDIHRPDTILLPTKAWLYLTDKRYGDLSSDSGQTVLEAAMATLGKMGVSNVLWTPPVGYSEPQEKRLLAHGISANQAKRLAGGLGDGKQTMVVLRRSAEILELAVAKERTMYPARQEKNDRVEIRFMQGSGDLVVYQPAAVKIVTDCGPDTLI